MGEGGRKRREWVVGAVSAGEIGERGRQRVDQLIDDCSKSKMNEITGEHVHWLNNVPKLR